MAVLVLLRMRLDLAKRIKPGVLVLEVGSKRILILFFYSVKFCKSEGGHLLLSNLGVEEATLFGLYTGDEATLFGCTPGRGGHTFWVVSRDGRPHLLGC